MPDAVRGETILKISGFLQNDTPFGRCVGTVLDMCGLNLLWMLCCLPIMTAGAATCGLYYALSKRDVSEESVYKCFFRSFRSNFKRATSLWLILLAVGISLAASVWIISGFPPAVRNIAIAFLSIPAILLLMIGGYGFPLLARFEVGSVMNIIADSVMLGIAYFPKTIQIAALILLPIVVTAALPVIVACVLFIWLPCGFAVTALLIQKRLEPIFDRITVDRLS